MSDLPQLVVIDGPHAGTRRPLDGDVVIGREGVDLVLDDGQASRRHAVVRRSGDGTVTIEDLGSTNGTRVDGTPVDGTVVLTATSRIMIGRTTLGVEGLAARPVPTGPPATEVAAAPAVAAPPPAPAVAAPPHEHPAPAVARAAPRGHHGIASRSITATVLTLATIAATAVALIIYFAVR